MEKQTKEELIFRVIFITFGVIGFGASILDTIIIK